MSEDLHRPLDTRIRVSTPENIAFEYAIAGPFRRLPAFLLDVLIKFAALGLIAFALAIGLGSLIGELGVAAAQVVILLGLFVTSWLYGAAFEAWANGRTIGKWALGLRVVSIDGHAINGSQALLRNLVTAADMLPPCFIFQSDDFPGFPLPTFLVGLVSMALTRRQQRLGDLAAGTMVVIDERSWASTALRVEDPRVEALASFIPPGFRVSPSLARAVAAYVERRRYLSPPRRAEIARHVTAPLIEEFEFRQGVDPDLLLLALYWKTFWADSQRESRIIPELAGHSPLRRGSTWRAVGEHPATPLPADSDRVSTDDADGTGPPR
jgi:uncharacterized RDD family membrane protein YckC